jgi:hypothetical protein
MIDWTGPSGWTGPDDIRAKVKAKWDSGAILRDLIPPAQGELFPLRIRLKGPGGAEIAGKFSVTSAWIKHLRASSKEALGYGYVLLERETNLRGIGRNVIPTHAVIGTALDAVRMLDKTKEANGYKVFCEEVVRSFPEHETDIREVLAKSPGRWLPYVEEYPKLIATLKWMLAHPDSGLYVRQVDIEGVDTKYIEKRTSVLSALMGALRREEEDDLAPAPPAAFEQRYGFQSKPPTVRFRLLDRSLYRGGLSDISTPVEQFAGMDAGADPEMRKVFITENEINGLSFPDIPGGMVVFGLGYGIDVLKAVPWLKDKEIIYWGDIDTHGYAMLSEVRSFLPQARSILMDEATLLEYRPLWSREKEQFTGSLRHLTGEENSVFEKLKTGAYGENVRFEQERVPFVRVMEVLNDIR